MTGPESRLRHKFIGLFRLVDACERPGCPVCRCLESDARQYLGFGGFCNCRPPILRSAISAPRSSSSMTTSQTEKLIARTLPNWGSCPGPSLWASKVVKLASVCGAMPNWFASAATGG